MIVNIDINVTCPECGCVMTRFDDYISCGTSDCVYFGRRFEKPTVIIHEIITEHKSETKDEVSNDKY